MECSSSRLEDEGEVESEYNDNELTDEDDPEIELDDKEDNDVLYEVMSGDDRTNNDVVYEVIDGDDKIEEPKKAMMFDSVDEVLCYYVKYAKQEGFAVVKRGNKKKDNVVRHITYACIRQGKQRKIKSDAVPTIIHTNCPARICAMLCANGKWMLTKIVLEHNHSLSPGKARLMKCHRKIEATVKRRLDINDRAGIRASKNFNSLVVEMGGYENLSFGEKDCRNFINKARELRLGKGGGPALRDYFSRMQKKNPGFYYVMDMDDDCRLRNVFWADARSRAAYEYFGDVISFDTTYLTNRYDMPFAPFVGVNHHGQSMLFGAALISKEDTETFVWLFETWLGCMNGKAPSAILTDQARAMKNAIEIVFPKTTRHRYCLWHIMRKLPEKFAANPDFDGIRVALNNCVYESQTCEQFEENWKFLIETYQLEDNAWLNGLYGEKTFWVPVYVKDTFWAGMNTTQRSESMNAFFDGYVHSRTTLKEFVDQFDSALRKMVEKETNADFDSFNRKILCSSNFPLEESFQDVYTNAKFKEVQGEFRKVMQCNHSCLKREGAVSTYEVIQLVVVNKNIKENSYYVYYNEEEVEVKCTCAMFETRGILCSHVISVLLSNKVTTLPLKYFLTRWRKDVKRHYTFVKCSYDAFDGDPNDERYDDMCKNFNELALLASTSVDRYKKVIANVNMLKEEFRELEPIRCSQHSSVAIASSSCNEAIQSNDDSVMQSNMVLSPIKVKRIGRPRSSRMASEMEKAVKKSQRKANKPPIDNNAVPRSRKKQALKATQTPLPGYVLDDQNSRVICTQVGVPVDPTMELSKLVFEHNFEKAFNVALQSNDISIVSWLCSTVDLRWVLSLAPPPLSQGVQLNLLWQLACDIKNNSPQKLAWMTVVANSMVPTDPGIAMHGKPILFQVYAILNHQCTLPTITNVEISNIRLLMHAINSMLIVVN